VKGKVAAFIGAASGALGVLAAEAKLAQRRIKSIDFPPPPDPTGWYGREGVGLPVTLAILGDSSANGYGMEDAAETPGAVLADLVAKHTGRPVHLRDLAVTGARSKDLAHQVTQAIDHRADVAVILIGANDVVRITRPEKSVDHLEAAARRLRDAGVEVVVGLCPDFGAIKPLLPPLRHIAKAWSRAIAAEQAVRMSHLGVRTVPLADVLGDDFVARAGIFFGADKFHPSAVGYAAVADVLLPATLASVDGL